MFFFSHKKSKQENFYTFTFTPLHIVLESTFDTPNFTPLHLFLASCFAEDHYTRDLRPPVATIMDSITRNQVTAAQVQHLEDAARNPLTGQFWASGHDEILSSRRRLPVYGRYQEILDNYHQSQVIVILSETGTGKSTQVPQLLIYDEYSSGLPIACTQPRRLAATQLAGRVAKEMGVVLGEEVGYKIRGERMADKNQKKTRLVYLTEGVLLQQLISDRNLSEYACVVLDEAHERTADLDLLMELLKKAVGRRRDLKVGSLLGLHLAERFI